MAYPTTLDTFANPNPTSPRNSPSLAALISSIGDAAEAIEAKLGVDGSAVPSSIDYRLGHPSGGHDHDGTDSKRVSYNDLLDLPAGGEVHTHASHTGIGVDDHHADIHTAVKHTFRGALATKTVDQSLGSSGSNILVVWAAEAYDTNSLINLTNERIEFTTNGAGYYHIQARLVLQASSSGGTRTGKIRLNNTTDLDTAFVDLHSAEGASHLFMSTVRYFLATDYVEIRITHDDTDTIDATGSFVEVHQVGV